MTEADWLGSDDPRWMLVYLQGRVGDRKLRLSACACARRAWAALLDERSLRAVEAAERYADGLETAEGLAAAEEEAEAVAGRGRSGSRGGRPGWAASRAAACVAHRHAHAAAFGSCKSSLISAAPHGGFAPLPWWERLVHRGDPALKAAAERGLSALLRDVFGNPFRPVPLDPAWRTPTVASLAQAAYDDRQLPSGELDPARLLVLADALEEAGCDHADLLGHLRGPGPHVRGCRVLDALLGRG